MADPTNDPPKDEKTPPAAGENNSGGKTPPKNAGGDIHGGVVHDLLMALVRRGAGSMR